MSIRVVAGTVEFPLCDPCAVATVDEQPDGHLKCQDGQPLYRSGAQAHELPILHQSCSCKHDQEQEQGA